MGAPRWRLPALYPHLKNIVQVGEETRTPDTMIKIIYPPKWKWFCPSSSLCQHFYRGHFSRPGSRLLSVLRTQFFFLRDSLIRFVDNLYKSLTISYLIYLLYQMFFKKSNYLILVLRVGLEPTIFYLLDRYSNQLNYFRILKNSSWTKPHKIIPSFIICYISILFADLPYRLKCLYNSVCRIII